MEVFAESIDDILSHEFYEKEMKPWTQPDTCSCLATDEIQWIYQLAAEEEFIQSYFELEDLIFKLKNDYFDSVKSNSN
jgi:hypothetical protein